MATFKITPTTTVADLKEQFSNEVGGGVLRVYDGRSEAAEEATLVSLGAKEGELECRTSRTVGKFEEAFQDELNLKVKVYTPDNWVKVLDGITLAAAADLPKGMTKEKMEEFLSYQRPEKEEEDETKSAETIDVNDGYDKSVALAQETTSAAAAFHKLGDGYDDDEVKIREDLTEYPEDFFILLKKDGQFCLFTNMDDKAKNAQQIEEADEVYYRYKNEIYTSDETEDIVMDNSEWGCEDYSLDDAIEDVLSEANEYEWPAIDVDFYYNGEVFFSFTL